MKLKRKNGKSRWYSQLTLEEAAEQYRYFLSLRDSEAKAERSPVAGLLCDLREVESKEERKA